MILSHRKIILPLPIILLAVIDLIVFFIKVHGQFIADDFIIFSTIKRSAWSIEGLLSIGNYEYASFFRPIPPLIWKPLYSLVGMKPLCFHLFQLVLHFGNSGLIYFLFRKIAKEKVAFIGACLFSVYPGHTDAVMSSHYIFDTVVTFFFLVSILFLSISFEKKNRLFLIASLVSAVLSIFSKENAITLPAIVLIFTVHWLHRNGVARNRIISSSLLVSSPYFLLFLLYLVFRHFHGLPASSLLSLLSPNLLSKYPKIMTHFVLPFPGDHGLALFAAGTFLVALVGGFFCNKEARGAIVFGVAWIVITAFPTLTWDGLRFFYLPSIGFALILGEMLIPLSDRAVTRRMASFLICAIIFFYSAIIISRNFKWTTVWNISRDIQESFVKDVAPSVKKPARAYLYGLPPSAAGINCLSLGADECFDLLKREKGLNFYAGIKGIRPRAQFPEREIHEEAPVNYYIFDWDPSKRHFLEVDTRSDSRPFTPEENILAAWDFLRYVDAAQWEPANELMINYDRSGRQNKFITTGDASFLKSPNIGKSIKYVIIECRVRDRKPVPLLGQLFWVTGKDMVYNGDKSILFPMENDGLMHTYSLPVYINAWAMRVPIYKLAFRFGDRAGTEIEIASITLYGY